MKITVTETMFKDQFRAYGRQDQFSNEALGLLFDYLEEHEAGSGEETELDVIAICCEFCEMSEEEIRQNWSLDEEENIADFLQDNTSYVGETSSGFVFASF